MSRLRHGLEGSLLVMVLFGTALLTPVSSAAPPWVDAGKYASYRGDYNEPMIVRPGEYIKITVEFNWNISALTSTEITIMGSYTIAIQAYTSRTGQVGHSQTFGGFEIIQRNTSGASSGGGFDCFGMEQIGLHTGLWADNTSIGLAPSSTQIVGRNCLTDSFSANVPDMLSGTVKKYYDSETGLLLALDFGEVWVNVDSVRWQLTSSFIVPVTSTNIISIANYEILLAAAGIGSALLIVLGVIVVLERRRRQKRWLAAYARATTPSQALFVFFSLPN